MEKGKPQMTIGSHRQWQWRRLQWKGREGIAWKWKEKGRKRRRREEREEEEEKKQGKSLHHHNRREGYHHEGRGEEEEELGRVC